MAIAVALAMDAFAVAIVAGLAVAPMTKRHVFRLAFHFGLFQALMPLLGWSAGRMMHRFIASLDHWVAFGLLLFVGGKMIRAACSGNQRTRTARHDPTSGWQLVLLSIATSIDALAVGLSLALIGSAIILPAVIIGVVAAIFTCVGMLLGRQTSILWGERIELIGGLVLIALGIKIVLEHSIL